MKNIDVHNTSKFRYQRSECQSSTLPFHTFLLFYVFQTFVSSYYLLLLTHDGVQPQIEMETHIAKLIWTLQHIARTMIDDAFGNMLNHAQGVVTGRRTNPKICVINAVLLPEAN